MRKSKASRTTYCPECGREIGVVTAPQAPGTFPEFRVAMHRNEGVRCHGTGQIVARMMVVERGAA